jgi:hypothetical protein
MSIAKTIRWTNVVLRALMEAGIVLAFGYWGFHTGSNKTIHILLGILTPLLVFGFWGLVDFHNAGKLSEFYRLLQELVISLLAAFAIYKKGAVPFGISLAIVSLLYHALVYLNGDRILRNKNT